MEKTIKQKLEISFWAVSMDIADEAFDYIYEKWFKHDDDELEFDRWVKRSDEGIYAEWICKAVRRCSYIPETRYEPESIDYSSLIDVDEPKDWIKIFMKENNLDEESIDDIYVSESIEEDYDDYYDD